MKNITKYKQIEIHGHKRIPYEKWLLENKSICFRYIEIRCISNFDMEIYIFLFGQKAYTNY